MNEGCVHSRSNVPGGRLIHRLKAAVNILESSCMSALFQERGDAMNDCLMCRRRPCEVVAPIFVIKGFLIFYQKGSETIVGCVPCVRKELLWEIPRSLKRIILFPPAWLAMPVLSFPILLIRAAMLKPAPDEVVRFMNGETFRSKSAVWAAVAWFSCLVFVAIIWIYWMW